MWDVMAKEFIMTKRKGRIKLWLKYGPCQIQFNVQYIFKKDTRRNRDGNDD